MPSRRRAQTDASATVRAPLVVPSPQAGVALWLCELERDERELRTLASYLAPIEHERAARFGTRPLRDRWIAGRASLRIILGEALDTAPGSVMIVRGRRGRPQLGQASAGPDFNVSHTGNVALIALGDALAPGERIGVDVERADRVVNVERLSRKILTARERSEDAILDTDARRRAFLRRWTCKEAMSKATGDALSAPFGRLDVNVSSAPELREGPPPYTPKRWRLHAVDAGHGLVATLAVWRGE